MKFTDTRQKVFIDMDGVLADFDKEILRRNLQFGGKTNHDKHKYHREPGFYRNLDLIEGALSAWINLSSVFDAYILSTPSWNNPSSWTDKRLWVVDKLGPSAEKKLILCHNKGLFTGRALVDDRDTNNQENFNGQLIQFGSEEFPDWDSVIIELCGD